ncbi:DUF6185 family protein [Streptomyces sp. NBC_00019]|uniref:DUF6185 family protein n=1 Tax=Streptomyces sp. NBC_00019 TaxID=2975623 RepID=UPI00324F5EC4
MRKFLLLAVLLGLLVLSGAGTARAVETNGCEPEALKDAEVTSSVWMKHDGEDYTRAETEMVVKVPKAWPLSDDLLLNGDAGPYRLAMRCLLHDSYGDHPYRDSELRPWPPKVTVGAQAITVTYRAVSSVETLTERSFGVWLITPGKRLWTLSLARPPALEKSWWREITIDLGGRGGRDIWPMPTKGTATTLTWTWAKSDMPMPALWVRLQPPATKALVTRWNEDGAWSLTRSVTWLSWDLVFVPVGLMLVRRLSWSPGPATETPAEAATRRNLFLWVWLTLIISVLVEVNGDLPDVSTWWNDHEVAANFMFGACVGVLLSLFGRPRVSAVVAVAVAGVYPVTVAIRPEWFALPHDFWLDQNLTDEVVHAERYGGFWWLALASFCVAFVWLVGTVSVVQRIRAGARVQTAGAPLRGVFPWWILLACAVAAVVLVALALWARHNSWTQMTWLSAQDSVYWEQWRFTYHYNGLAWFPSNWYGWFYPLIGWWYGVIAALLATLAARAAAPHDSPVAPEGLTLALLTVLSFHIAWPTPGWYVGLWLSPITVPITLLAGLLLLAIGKRRAVLWQKPLPDKPLRDAIKESDRTWLIESARTYRDLHSRLRRLEQSDPDGKRAQLEQELDTLHHWKPPQAAPPFAGARLPDSVDAVELALAWGPRATWWQNACRAALFAALISLPANAVLFWANQVRGSLWDGMTRDELGVAGLLDGAIAYELYSAGLGFVLGALWRVLPGRRGPAKALGLFLVYAAPVAAHWLLTRATGQTFGTWPLDLALTLLVLTVTGVTMDIDTFRHEGIYWPTKASLLLSIYQLRTASVQLAFFVAQMVALVGVWQQLKGNDPMVLIQPGDPTDRSGSPDGTGP